MDVGPSSACVCGMCMRVGGGCRSHPKVCWRKTGWLSLERPARCTRTMGLHRQPSLHCRHILDVWRVAGGQDHQKRQGQVHPIYRTHTHTHTYMLDRHIRLHEDKYNLIFIHKLIRYTSKFRTADTNSRENIMCVYYLHLWLLYTNLLAMLQSSEQPTAAAERTSCVCVLPAPLNFIYKLIDYISRFTAAHSSSWENIMCVCINCTSDFYIETY